MPTRRPDDEKLRPMRSRPKARRGPPENIPVCWHCACGQTVPRHIGYCARCGNPQTSGDGLVWFEPESELIYRNITRR